MPKVPKHAYRTFTKVSILKKCSYGFRNNVHNDWLDLIKGHKRRYLTKQYKLPSCGCDAPFEFYYARD